MTPFGQKVRRLRKVHKITLKQFAQEMGVSSAYFSALEHGYRGRRAARTRGGPTH
ncbi:MAG: helix-turn-helix domain-containing protein [Rhodospirillales bacterium]